MSAVQALTGPFRLFRRYPCARRRFLSVSTRMALLSVRRIANRPFSFTLFGNVRLYARFDFGSPILAYYLGLYEEASMHFLLRYLRPDDTFADVGANVGIYTVLAAGAAGARVHAFEPFSVAHGALTQNVSLNALEGRVALHQQAVGAAAGTAFITTMHKGSNRIADAGVNEPLEAIDVVTLDDALGTDMPAAIKIDVEGHEEKVLLGARAVLSSPATNVVIIEAINRGDAQVARCVSLLEQRGFRMCTFDPHGNTLAECPRGSDAFVGPNDDNYLFVKDLATARRRIGERDGGPHGARRNAVPVTRASH